MQIYIGWNPIGHLQCWLENKREEVIEKKWRASPHRCICSVCGQVLTEKDPNPDACGWMRLKQKKYFRPYICHQCLCHHAENFRRLTEEEEDELREYYRDTKHNKKPEWYGVQL